MQFQLLIKIDKWGLHFVLKSVYSFFNLNKLEYLYLFHNNLTSQFWL